MSGYQLSVISYQLSVISVETLHVTSVQSCQFSEGVWSQESKISHAIKFSVDLVARLDNISDRKLAQK